MFVSIVVVVMVMCMGCERIGGNVLRGLVLVLVKLFVLRRESLILFGVRFVRFVRFLFIMRVV